MGPPSYIRSVVDRNVVMRHIRLLLKLLILLKRILKNSYRQVRKVSTIRTYFSHIFLLISGDLWPQTAVIWKGTEKNLDTGTAETKVHQQNSQSYHNLKEHVSHIHSCVAEERWMSGNEMKRKNCVRTHVDSRSVIAEHLQLKKWKARKVKLEVG